ncbi:Ppx/GppA family phosphatase [Filifactor villosus]|uniref:Ppx/GppA family phosphatase n=1 Tax=Filifactor villosus TaxID=29374 RepID=A0ABV9QI18_9FIRM
MKKIGSIDIGTNSMRLLIADDSEELSNRKKYVDITRLGYGVDENGYIDEDAMRRNLDVLKRFANLAKSQEVEVVEVIGTSALRDSKNRREFVLRAKEMTGLDVRVIEGSEEAGLGFCGAVSSLQKKGYVLLIDIGGGSTEFILGSQSEGILFSKSLDIGALRMTEKFISGSIPEKSELDAMRFYIVKQIFALKSEIKRYPLEEVVGIGGTITTFSAMVQGLKVYNSDKVHHSHLSFEQVEDMLDVLASKTLEERMMIDGLQPKRADIIVAGGMILKTVMQEFDVNKIVVSEYDNLEGMLYRYRKSVSKGS